MKNEYSFIELLKIENADELAKNIILRLLELKDFKKGAIYRLDNFTESYVKFNDDELFKDFRDSYSKTDLEQDSKFKELIYTSKSFFDSLNKSLFIPISRSSEDKKEYCVGFIHLLGKDLFSQTEISEVERIAVLFNAAFKRKFLYNLLHVLNQPIDFTIDSDEYLDDILDLTIKATGFPLVALREYDHENESLICIRHKGFYEENPPPSLTNEDLSDVFYHIFLDVLVDRKSKQFDYKKALNGHPDLDSYNIKRFIVLPILVGDAIWGILSFATRCNHYFDNNEILGLETVAHGIGVSISNYRNYHKSSSKRSEIAISAAMIKGNEAAQFIRHEARNHIAEATHMIANIIRKNKNLENDLNSIGRVLNGAVDSLDKMKTITSMPEGKPEKSSIKEVWEEAKSLVYNGFDELNIKFKPLLNLNQPLYLYKDWLRHAFLNLLLNSIDAFKDAKKQNREISFIFEKETDNSIVLTYGDNAGGIEPNKLKISDMIPDEIKSDMNRLIFEPQVTSKGKNGSGYGLYLTRLAIQEYHKGSINLVRYRGGVTFNIEISKKIKYE